MSNVLAIAAVTQLLKDMLNDAMINGDVSQVMGADFLVTALPPDRVVNEAADQQQPTLNLFLHRITPNAALQQEDFPTRDASGRLTRRPRLARASDRRKCALLAAKGLLCDRLAEWNSVS